MADIETLIAEDAAEREAEARMDSLPSAKSAPSIPGTGTIAYALATHLAAYQMGRVYPDAEAERVSLAEEIVQFLRENPLPLPAMNEMVFVKRENERLLSEVALVKEAHNHNVETLQRTLDALRKDRDTILDQGAAVEGKLEEIEKERDAIAGKLRLAQALAHGLRHDLSKVRKDRLEMMFRCRAEVRDMRARIDRLEPLAQAYSDMSALLALHRRNGYASTSDFASTLDREIAKAEAEAHVASAAFASATPEPEDLPEFLHAKEASNG